MGKTGMTAIVKVTDVVKDYPLGKVTVNALRGVSLRVEQGEFLTIAGPSGSGKTTLLNQIGCVDTPTAGTVHVNGSCTSELSEKALTSLRLNTLGFIFQSFNLVAVLDVAQNVELPLLLKGGLSSGERASKVDALLDQMGILDQRKQRPNELSGGQRQRVAIARALVTEPLIVLADEPTANLDSETGDRIIALMEDINRRAKTTFIFSTHDERVMARARRIIRMVDGRLAEDTRADHEAP